MTIDKQPRALYLADVLTAGFECDQEWYEIESAKELRRLHAENEDFRATCDHLTRENAGQIGEIDHARELRRHSRKLGEPVGETAGVMQRAADEIERLRAMLAAASQPKLYPLPDDLYGGSKDWRAGSYAERVEWLHLMYEGAKEEIERLGLGQTQGEQEQHLNMVPPGWKLVPVKPKRQPLTEMEIVELRQLTPGTLDVQFVKFARAIERAHGIGGEAKTRMCPSTYYECGRGCGDGGCKDFSDAYGIGGQA